MNITVDTNVLIRAVVQDDPIQPTVAVKVLKNAELIAVALPCLCEFVWFLNKLYHFKAPAIANAIRALLAASNVQTNRPAVEAGLAFLDAGGDFSDGVIAFEGNWLGADTFVSFDKKAVSLLASFGQSVLQL